jgi:hypothetical protein
MKNRKTVLVFVLMAVLAVTACAQQYDPESDFRVEPVDGGKSVRITRYVGNKWTVRIPPLIQKLPVTDIGRVFSGNKNLTSVTIPNSVTNIVNDAFSGCTNLASITVPNGVTSIGQRAFSGCTNLASITIPNGITSLGQMSCLDCTSLTSITIGNGVKSMEENVFIGCTKLAVINVDAANTAYSSDNGILLNKNKTILIQCPWGKTGTYTIPNSVTTIGDRAFQESSLASITIPNSVTDIRQWAFGGCTSLTSISIPNSVTTIGWFVFTSCTSLTNVTIGNSVTTIGENAFSGCTSLTSITIPDSVTSIGNYAFDRCTNLTSVTFQGTINSNNFMGANSSPFDGDLRDKFYATDRANGTPGTYTRASGSTTWTKQ